MNFLRGFLDNDSAFGRLMHRCWIIIAANLLFVLLSIPFVTIGPGWCAMSHVFLRTLRGDGEVNPLREYWRGLRTNFRQALISWLLIAALLGFLGLEIYWCGQFGGAFEFFRLGLVTIAAGVVMLAVYLYPTMAAFSDTLPALLRHSLYFALHRPLNFVVILFFHIFPMVLTYSDLGNLPLYAFLWCTFGFGAVGMLTASLLVREFEPFLPEVDQYGNFIAEGETVEPAAPEQSEAEILEELRKLDM